jgi:membrane protein
MRLRELTQLGFEESEGLLQRKLDSGWVGRVRSDPGRRARLGNRSQQYEDRWALLVSPDKLTLADVYQRFAFAPAPQSALATKIEAVVDRGLAISLTDYFAEAQANRNKLSST